MHHSLFQKPGFIQITHCMGGEGVGGYGTDSDEDGKISVSESFRDMTDGGGKGTSGKTFGGALGGISNALGATPRGSGETPTGLANIASMVTGIGGKANPGMAAIMGAMTGGLPGLAMGYASAKAKNAVSEKGGIAAALGLQQGGPNAAQSRPQPRADSFEPPSSGGESGAMGPSTTARPAPTVPLNMSQEAAQGAFNPVANPAYDASNPLSSRFLNNPTYAQLLAARGGQQPQSPNATPMMPGMNYNPMPQSDPLGFAEGGEIPMPEGMPAGGNEKTLISSAVQAVKGGMPEEQAAIALGMFLKTYGREALQDLVERVRSGELDDTISRSEGKIAGPGDGMNDRVPASIDGKQDVLLSDGEFIVPADVVSGVGNGSSEAGAKELEKFMKRVRSERTGKSEQPAAIDPAAMMPAR